MDRQLIEVTGPAGTRYRLHDLIRLYARERAERDDSAAERARVVRDGLKWYASRLDAWMSEPGAHEHPPDAALEWFAEEWPNVQAALRAAYQNEEWALLRDMSGALYGLLWYRGLWKELETTRAWGVEAARREGDETAELGALIHLAEARRALHRADETPQLYERALRIARSRGDRDKEGWILTHYGDLQCDLGHPRTALGLSGFETGVAVMPLVSGRGETDAERLQSRIANTRKMLTTAASIMIDDAAPTPSCIIRRRSTPAGASP